MPSAEWIGGSIVGLMIVFAFRAALAALEARND